MMEEVGIPQVHRKEFKAIALKVVSILEEKAKEGIAVTQIDLNPVVITKQGDVLAVDARLLFVPEEENEYTVVEIERNLDSLIFPETAAVIGKGALASDIRSSMKGGLGKDGKMKKGLGEDNVWDTLAVDGPVDIAIICVSPDDIKGVFQEMIDKARAQQAADPDRALSCIVISAGFSEKDEAGKEIEKRLTEMLTKARDEGIKINIAGGNSMGFYVNAPGFGYDSWFIPTNRYDKPDFPGNNRVAFVSKSGARLIMCFNRAPRVGVAAGLSIGNCMDLAEADYVYSIIKNKERLGIDIIALYLEGSGMGEGRRLTEAVEQATKVGITVVANIAAGKTEAAKEQAQSHTAKIATEEVIAKAALKAAGAIIADKPTDLERTLNNLVLGVDEEWLTEEEQKILDEAAKVKLTKPVAIAGIDTAGCGVVEIANYLPKGFSFTKLGKAAEEAISHILEKRQVKVRNPVDTTPQCNDEKFAQIVEELLKDEGVEAIIVSCVPNTPVLAISNNEFDPKSPYMKHLSPDYQGIEARHPQSLVNRLIELRRKYDKPMLVAIPESRNGRYSEAFKMLEEAGIPVFDSAWIAAQALPYYIAKKNQGDTSPTDSGPQSGGSSRMKNFIPIIILGIIIGSWIYKSVAPTLELLEVGVPTALNVGTGLADFKSTSIGSFGLFGLVGAMISTNRANGPPDFAERLMNSFRKINLGFILSVLSGLWLAWVFLTPRLYLYMGAPYLPEGVGYNYIQILYWRSLLTFAALGLFYTFVLRPVVIPILAIVKKAITAKSGWREKLKAFFSNSTWIGVKKEIKSFSYKSAYIEVLKDIKRSWKLYVALGIFQQGLALPLSFAALKFVSSDPKVAGFYVLLFIASSVVMFLTIDTLIYGIRKIPVAGKLYDKICKYHPETLPQKHQVVLALLAAFGVFIALGGLTTNLAIGGIGLTLLILTDVFFAWGTIYNRLFVVNLKKQNQTYDPTTAVGFACLVGMACFITIAAIVPSFAPGPKEIFAGITIDSITAVIPHWFNINFVTAFSILYYTFFYAAPKYGAKPANLGIAIAISPACMKLSAWIFYGGTLAWEHIFGSLLIVVAIILFNYWAQIAPSVSKWFKKLITRIKSPIIVHLKRFAFHRKKALTINKSLISRLAENCFIKTITEALERFLTVNEVIDTFIKSGITVRVIQGITVGIPLSKALEITIEEFADFIEDSEYDAERKRLKIVFSGSPRKEMIISRIGDSTLWHAVACDFRIYLKKQRGTQGIKEAIKDINFDDYICGEEDELKTNPAQPAEAEGEKAKQVAVFSDRTQKIKKILLIVAATLGRKLTTDKIPLGALYLYQSLKQHFADRIDVEILDLATKDEKFDFDEFVRINNPDSVWISIHGTAAISASGEICRRIKNILPEVNIVAGGVQTSTEPEYILNELPIDIVARGEGEIIAINLVEAINSGRDLASIKGISYKAGNGKILHNPDERVLDMDELPLIPPADFNIDDYDLNTPFMDGKTINIMFTRGCPYNCSYCSYKAISGQRSRSKSAQRQLEEIEYIMDTLGIHNFYFFDDSLGLHREIMVEFCRLVIERGLDIHWRGQTRVNLVDRELLELMKRAGLNQLSFGVESGDQEVLDLLRKRTTLQQIKGATERCRELGIHTRFFLMAGLPFQTYRFPRALWAAIKRRELRKAIIILWQRLMGQWVSS
ncbi:MAG: radical SAM protein, partial [Candidatus Omnitrophica bacterium]|nr:radical SAM protein [Candidatus Omnitrophota bacterium]